MILGLFYKDGWAITNDYNLEYEFKFNEHNQPMVTDIIKMKNLFVSDESPPERVKVLTENNKGFFCTFESNEKLIIVQEMDDEQIKQTKWQIINKHKVKYFK